MENQFKILKDDHPSLRKKSLKVKNFQEVPKISGIMKKIMKSHFGVGLAAPQIGINQRIIVKGQVTQGQKDMVLVNPKIILRYGSAFTTEGCLSVTDITKEILRSRFILVMYQDILGKYRFSFFKDLESIIIQHEIDHLDGILISDY